MIIFGAILDENTYVIVGHVFFPSRIAPIQSQNKLEEDELGT